MNPKFPGLFLPTFGIAVLACALIGPAVGKVRVAPATTTTGPFQVNDSADAFAIKGVSTEATGTPVAVFGLTSSTVGCCQTGVTGESSGPTSTGVTGYQGGSGGYGVFGEAVSGNGVYGGTLTSSKGNSGVIGVDGTTGTPGPNYGVTGKTVQGYGVYGYASGAYGNAGYFVSSLSTGGAATLGAATGEGGIFKGLSGTAAHPALTTFAAKANTDLFGTYGYNGGGTPNETFVVQSGTQNASGYAEQSPAGSDVQVSGDLYVYGLVFQNCATFPETNGNTDCESAGSDAAPLVPIRSSSDEQVRTYRARQSSPTMEDFGEAQLVNGQAVVPLDATYLRAIDTTRSYLVFITSEGENHGLYVTGKSASGFVVREMMNGHSSCEFEYRVVAHPYGEKPTRLAIVQHRQRQSVPQIWGTRTSQKVIPMINLSSSPGLRGTSLTSPR